MTNEEANKKAIEYFRNVFSDAVCNNASLANPAYLAVKALKEQKTGRWIPPENEMAQKYGKAYSFRCSECGEVVHTECFKVISEFDYKFCPYCGAKMEKKDEICN